MLTQPRRWRASILLSLCLGVNLTLPTQGLLPRARLGAPPLPCPPARPSRLRSPPQRTFLKHPESKKNIPIHAIGLSLYESLPGTTAEQIGQQVVRTQWLYVPPHPAVLEAIVAEIGTTPTAVPSPGGSFWAAARSSW